MSLFISHRFQGSNPVSRVKCQKPHALRPSLLVSVPRQLIAQGLLVGLLATLGTSVSAQPAGILTVAQTQDSAKISAIDRQLQGLWQTKDPKTGKVVTFIFAPNGQLFTVLPAPDGSSIAVKMSYKINPTTQPMQLDVIVSPEQTAMTIFQLTPEGKLRLELDGITPGKPRPASFSSTSTLFEKISQATTVPKDIQVIALETQKANAGQGVVKQYLTIVSQAQQAYYKEKGKFAANVEELGIVTNLETQQYRYQIVPQKDNRQSVMITAIAKNSNLPSYTSAVFATKVNGKTTTTAQICETDKPSTSPPAMPVPPTGSTAAVQCPAGSRPLR